LKYKRYHDKRRNVRKSGITVGEKILMKNKRTDPLCPIPGKVINIRGNAVTARFDDGKVFMRKSHISRLYERDLITSRDEKKYEEKKRFKATYSTGAESIKLLETSCRNRLIVTKKIN
jgi:hypothetical protein